MIFIDANGRPLELIELTRYTIEPRIKKYVTGYGFLSFVRNLSEKYMTNIRYCHKKGTRCCKNYFQTNNQ